MIDSVSLRNFQCHRELDIKFTNRINLITGTSDVGKSAIIRALHHCIFNSIQGDSYVTFGAQDSHVTIESDGHRIQRSRESGQNKYYIDDTMLTSIGVNELPEIHNIFNLDRRISFQNQHEGGFIITWSPQEIYQFFNQLVDLDSIDKAMKKSKTRLTDTENAIKAETN